MCGGIFRRHKIVRGAGALRSPAAITIEGLVDQADMAEGLRDIAKHLARDRIMDPGKQADIIDQLQQPFLHARLGLRIEKPAALRW